MDPARNNLLEALNQVERRTEFSASGWRLLLYASVLVPLAAVFPEWLWGKTIFDVPEYSMVPFGPAMLVASGCLVTLAVLAGLRMRKITRERIEVSNLAVQLASGEFKTDQIFEHTSWPWRLLLPGGSENTTLTDIIRRVAWNLDWYLKRPGKLWRWNWILVPLSIALAAAFVGIPLLNWLLSFLYTRYRVTPPLRGMWVFYSFGEDTALRFNLVLLAVLAILPVSFIYYRRQIWTEELVRHLRERLEA